MTIPLGITLYDGPSQLTGDRIVAVLSGVRNPSTNAKTGPMVQAYILSADVPPVEAVDSGADAAVCGSCPHRKVGGMGTCYVTVFRGPNQVYKSWSRGNYPVYDPARHDQWLQGRAFRIGAYGDPAAVPIDVWDPVLRMARTWTGYTHAWREADPGFSRLVMASADSPEDRDAALALGYRTFRVRPFEDAGAAPLAGETVCPASDEFFRARGYKTTCLECGLCSGTSRAGAKDIVIAAHGTRARSFTEAPIQDLEVLA